MELTQLRYFVAVASVEHFSRAAMLLHVAQPALSRQVHLLETELGVALFERLARGVRLTAAGRRFMEDVRQVLADLDAARLRAQRIARGEVARLRLGYSHIALWSGELSRMLHEFASRHSQLELTLTPLDPVQQWAALRDRHVDAGLMHFPPTNLDGAKSLPVASDHVVLALPATHPLARQPSVSLSDIGDEPFVWMPREVDPGFYDLVSRACRAARLTMRVVQEATDASTLLDLTASGFGLSFTVASACRHAPRRVVLRPVNDARLKLTLSLVWRVDNELSALRALINFLGAPGAAARDRRSAPEAPTRSLRPSQPTRSDSPARRSAGAASG
jgi:DNA-binding transcriptional LysR family regulator